MKQRKLNIKKLSVLFVVCYLFLAVAFYYLAGYQLHFLRRSNVFNLFPFNGAPITDPMRAQLPWSSTIFGTTAY